MNFFNLFQSKSKFFFVYLGILGLIHSVWSSALLLLVNNKITDTPLPYADEYDWLIYLVLIVVSFIVAAWFQSYMIKLTYNLGNELGLSIFDKLRFTNLQDYIKLGEEKVRTSMSDVVALQRFPSTFLESFNAIVMVVIGIAYLMWLDVIGAGIFVGMIVLIGFIYGHRNDKIEDDLESARELANIFMQNVNDFLGGFKEVKMSMNLNDNLFKKHITVNRNKAKDLTISALVRHLGNELLGGYAFFILIGAVLFLMPVVVQMSGDMRTNFLVTLLFLMGPIGVVIGVMEDFIRMKIAMNRLNEFTDTINVTTSVEKGYGDLTPINETFKSIRFENVTFEYFDHNGELTFSLKPLNLEVKKGETVFVTGGNGSGKSTFINILSGLYVPTSGSIYLNDHLITIDNYAYYREQLSCIFTDNYLFGDNYYGLDLSSNNKRFMYLLKKMKLTDVVQFDEKNNRISHNLSKGQQKRMALIYALLEGKDILIFDEWAAEQDPSFRKYFYKTIIPELKNSGKTIIAVTHDDAYFQCAERLLKFDYGEIVKDLKLAYAEREDLRVFEL